MLHAVHYFMANLVTFSEESARNVFEKVHLLPPYAEPLGRFQSSRLLNRQIKCVMHKLTKDITEEVLDGLEKSMRSKSKSSWGESFCAILILSLCIDSLQTAADTFVVCDIEKSEKEGIDRSYSRRQSFDACQALENYPFLQCKRLFHDIYRSHKQGNGGLREGGFNPFRDIVSAEVDLDTPTKELVKALRWVAEEHSKFILDFCKSIS